MKVFEIYKNIPAEFHNSIVVIGNFDGVHRGHTALLQRAAELAAQAGSFVSVLTFEPHPRKLFRPDDPPFRLTPPGMKAALLEKAGVGALFSLPFDWDFASLPAERFVQDVLLNGLKPAHVVVGYDFHFGQLRKGSADTIKDMGLPVTVISEVQGASSTAIRQALRHGNMDEANALLGWDWEISGVVESGDKRGRLLGYPTANFALGDIAHPAYGVYAARVQVEGEAEWRGAAINIGIRPMFELTHARVESYIFDFDREIYGQVLKVRPVRFLRGEAKFDSVEQLISQIDRDCTQAKEVLKG